MPDTLNGWLQIPFTLIWLFWIFIWTGMAFSIANPTARPPAVTYGDQSPERARHLAKRMFLPFVIFTLCLLGWIGGFWSSLFA